MSSKKETALRQAIIDGCLRMNAEGMNQGTSGNISARHNGRMLITPSGTPYEKLRPNMITTMSLDEDDDSWEGPLKPSTEWHFHRDILRKREEIGAVVHLHSTFATVLAMARKPIPSCHYMVACFGGNDVRCAGYARYGTPELSELAVEALEGRTACLLANHGMIAIGATLDKALWTAVELETLAKQYYHTLAIGGPVMLNDEHIEDTLRGIASYGLQDDAGKEKKKKK
ncbi:MAG: class II aldolase/adducin family protein [Stappiaceae bacterium]